MKTNITVTVDIEVIAEARRRLGNISKFVNDALKEALTIKDTEIPADLNDLQLKLSGRIAEVALLQSKMKEMQKKIDQEKPVHTINLD